MNFWFNIFAKLESCIDATINSISNYYFMFLIYILETLCFNQRWKFKEKNIIKLIKYYMIIKKEKPHIKPYDYNHFNQLYI